MSLQGTQTRIGELWCFAVHTVPETSLKTLLEGIHMPVLAAVGGIGRVGRPHRRRTALASGFQVAVAAPQLVANERGGICRRIAENLFTEPYDIAELAGRNGTVRRRPEWPGAGSLRARQLFP